MKKKLPIQLIMGMIFIITFIVSIGFWLKNSFEKTGNTFIYTDKGLEPCIQEIVYARSPSGKCKKFSTPCAVPDGWTKDQSCAPARKTNTI